MTQRVAATLAFAIACRAWLTVATAASAGPATAGPAIPETGTADIDAAAHHRQLNCDGTGAPLEVIDELVEAALADNPRLLLSAAAIRANRLARDAAQATRPPLEIMGMGAVDPMHPGDGVVDAGITVAQPLPNRAQRSASVRALQARGQAATCDEAAAAWAVRGAIQRDLVEAARVVRARLLVADLASLAEQSIERVSFAARAGQATYGDLIRMQLTADALAGVQDALDADWHGVVARLVATVGDEERVANALVAVTTDAADTTNAPSRACEGANVTVRDLLDRVTDERTPAVAAWAARSMEERQQAGAREAQRRAQWVVSATWGRMIDRSPSARAMDDRVIHHTVGLGLGVMLPTDRAARLAALEARERAAMNLLEREQAQRELEAGVRSRGAALEAIDRRLRRLDSQQLPGADRLLDTLAAEASAGRVDWLELARAVELRFTIELERLAMDTERQLVLVDLDEMTAGGVSAPDAPGGCRVPGGTP